MSEKETKTALARIEENIARLMAMQCGILLRADAALKRTCITRKEYEAVTKSIDKEQSKFLKDILKRVKDRQSS